MKFFSESREKAIELLEKSLSNIISDPTEEKKRKLRVNHKVIQEKIFSQKGTVEFLEAVGWKKVTLDEDFYIYSDESVEPLQAGLEALKTDELPRPKLHRNPKIKEPREGLARPEIPVCIFIILIF